jgi:hypothetical protein
MKRLFMLAAWQRWSSSTRREQTTDVFQQQDGGKTS